MREQQTNGRKERTYRIGEESKSELGQLKFVTSEYRSSKKECRVGGCRWLWFGRSRREREKARFLQVKSRAGERGKSIWDNNKHKTNSEGRKRGNTEREQPRSWNLFAYSYSIQSSLLTPSFQHSVRVDTKQTLRLLTKVTKPTLEKSHIFCKKAFKTTGFPGSVYKVSSGSQLRFQVPPSTPFPPKDGSCSHRGADALRSCIHLAYTQRQSANRRL